VKDVRVTHIGGPTALIEVGGWRILTDPTFDAPGRWYYFGWGTSSRKLTGPGVPADSLGTIDAVLLSHDHHADNLDTDGRALLPASGTVITTASGARRLTAAGLAGVRGLEPWAVTELAAPGRPTIEITATPCRHGPAGSHLLIGDVIGFALKWDGQEQGVLWVSGDTVLFEGIREVARRLTVDTALLHLGGVRFPITAGLHYSLTAKQAVQVVDLVRPRTVIPVHYEGWKHFRQGRDAVQRELDRASPDVSGRFSWLPIGRPVDLEG
jgi:L-ascorbate metabolism protein UlaG (beta-lactamase superfamily)